jgi:MYXO-CTERM domain-containing protein
MPRMLAALALLAPNVALADEADDDFAARCSHADVVACVGFDDAADIAGDSESNSGILPGATTPMLDASTRASGASSLLFTIPSNSAADTSGSYFTNFSEDLSVQFDGDSEFYVQWRQRFSPEFIAEPYVGGGGWKQAIIGTGDQPAQRYYSCTSLEVVTQNSGHRSFPQMYNSCSGSASHGPYAPFEEPFDAYDFKLQNARPEPYCLYSQGQTDPATYFPPDGNCFGYVADEWMTFQVGITTGPRQGDEFVDSHVRLWVAREGEPAELVLEWGPYNLTAGAAEEMQRFGKVWLLPYNTGKDESAAHPMAFTWYDELIVSRSRIADPGAPAPPDDDTGGEASGSEGSGGDASDSGGEEAGSTAAGSSDGPDDGSGTSSTNGNASSDAVMGDDEDASGCGCRTSRGNAWMMLALLGFAYVRRR